MSELESARESFDWFADWAEGVAPLYEQLARKIRDDDRLLELSAPSQNGQPASNMLFAAVHYLLLEGTDQQLAKFYPSIRSDPLDPTEGDPFPAFREFCLEHEETIRELVRTRRVQTNAVGRSALLFPAFKFVDDRTSNPLALVEIGSSAGLNLLWDRYRYEYGDLEPCGNVESPVTIETEIRGETTPPRWEDEPEIGHRIGIDINPLDVTDSEDARWLRALVIPDQVWRFDRLDGAIEVASEDPPTLVVGDALEELPDVIQNVPTGYDVCVFSTLVLYQMDDGVREELRSILRQAGQERPIHWLSNDPEEGTSSPVYRYVTFDGEPQTRQLAEFQAHGDWIRWHGEQ